jgi:hypothetical protein
MCSQSDIHLFQYWYPVPVSTPTLLLRSVLRIRDILSRIRTFSHPGSEHFLIPDPDPNNFHPESYMKSGMQTYYFLASYGFRSKSLSLSLSQKDPGYGIHPGSVSQIQWRKSSGSGSVSLILRRKRLTSVADPQDIFSGSGLFRTNKYRIRDMIKGVPIKWHEEHLKMHYKWYR